LEQVSEGDEIEEPLYPEEAKIKIQDKIKDVDELVETYNSEEIEIYQPEFIDNEEEQEAHMSEPQIEIEDHLESVEAQPPQSSHESEEEQVEMPEEEINRVQPIDQAEEDKQSEHISDIPVEMDAEAQYSYGIEKDELINVFDANLENHQDSEQVSSNAISGEDIADFDQMEQKIELDEETGEFKNFKPQRIETDLQQDMTPGQAYLEILERNQNEEDEILEDIVDKDDIQDTENALALFEGEAGEFDHEELIKKKKVDILTMEVFNTLVEEVMMDGFVLRELLKLQAEPSKGIKTNINAVKNYLTELTEFIKGNPPLTVDKYQKNVLFQLNNPLGPTPEERLRLFHAVGDDDNLDSSYAKINYEQVLDIDIYFELEDKLMVQKSLIN
jgi:hypothetical protein